MSQHEIPVEPAPEPRGPCAWCGEDSVAAIRIEKPRYGKAHNGVRVLKKHAIVVPVCAEHEARFKTDEEEA